jgi:hypothetical protein
MPSRPRRYVVFPGMVDSTEQQRQIVQEVLRLHHQSTDNATDMPCLVHDQDTNYCPRDKIETLLGPSIWDEIKMLQTSRKLELGLSSCGGNVTDQLPIATTLARQAFTRAAHEAEKCSILDEKGDSLFNNGISSNDDDKTSTTSSLSLNSSSLKLLQTMGYQQQEQHEGKCNNTPLTGLSLLYGPLASMPAHYDSPTQPGQREEWLAMISIGSSIIFRCNDELIRLDSGDVIVMDSMATLHGVERVLVSTTDESGGWNHVNHTELGLPTPCRLGLLFWQGRPTDEKASAFSSHDEEEVTPSECLLDGVGDLFADESDSDDDDDVKS